MIAGLSREDSSDFMQSPLTFHTFTFPIVLIDVLKIHCELNQLVRRSTRFETRIQNPSHSELNVSIYELKRTAGQDCRDKKVTLFQV